MTTTERPARAQDLPSGGWYVFRERVGFGARKQRARINIKLGIKLRGEGKDTQADSVDIAGADVGDLMEREEYFPVCYMLEAWSYPLPLPTIEDLSSLDEIDLADGDLLVALAEAALKPLDFSPDGHADPDSPTTASGA